MSGILEQLIKGLDSPNLQKTISGAVGDDERGKAASGAALGTILRGLEKKAQTPEGQKSLWDMLKKQQERGNVPTQTPSAGSGVQVHELDPQVTDEILEGIFGKQASQIENRVGKVVTLDSETTKKLMGAILPAVLGGLFGQAEQHPQESPQALPDILANARKEMDHQQPKSGGFLDAILDADHDGDVDLSDLAGIFGKLAK